jgi:drug/metabolite transporter (DMT)-like permease
VAPGATIGFGVLIPAIDRLTPAAGRIGAVALVFLLELAVVVPLFAMRGLPMRPPPRAAWPAVLGAGLFETAGFVWISVGLSQAPVTVVSPLASLSMALTVLAAWLVLGERPPALVLAGAALACAGVVTLSL